MVGANEPIVCCWVVVRVSCVRGLAGGRGEWMVMTTTTMFEDGRMMMKKIVLYYTETIVAVAKVVVCFHAEG